MRRSLVPLIGLTGIVVLTAIVSLSSARSGSRVSAPLKAAELSPTPTTPPVISVTADQNTLSITSFRIPHPGSLDLMVTAVDRDYLFSLPDLGVNQIVSRNTTAPVRINGLGVGTYTMVCGPTCSAMVEIYNTSDDE